MKYQGDNFLVARFGPYQETLICICVIVHIDVMGGLGGVDVFFSFWGGESSVLSLSPASPRPHDGLQVMAFSL